MAIRMMCDKNAAGAVPMSESERQSYGLKPEHEMYLRTYAVGCVVALREMNGYDDSDFYATYYDAEKGTFEEVMYGTTRGWSYPNGAAVDAIPEIVALYEAHIEAAHRRSRATA